MRVLVTGFGPFGSVVDNPTARIVSGLADAGLAGHELATAVLPVSFRRSSAEIERLLAAHTPDVVLMLGVAAGAPGIRLETTARNFDDARAPDCDGASPAESTIAPGEPDTRQATLAPGPLLARLLANGHEAVLSDNAGGYVCNHAYYSALSFVARAGLPTRCLFVHVPADPATCDRPLDGPTVPLDRTLAAVTALLAAITG